MHTPWLGDACGLVDAFRSGEITPLEATEACLAAIEGSAVNAFSYVDAEGARDRARTADVSKPLGGLPIGVKELDRIEGWPYTEASLVFADRKATFTSTFVQRLIDAGANPIGLTTASEFGFVNYTSTRLNGVTTNPWNPERTPGGSSGGSAAAVAAGLVPMATAGDGGGSIRIPAGYSGLLGLKGTFGRIPRGPQADIGFLNVVLGCTSRSVRDTARWLDVTNGHDPRDQFSLPRVEGWEAGLGSHELRGLKVAIAPNLDAIRIHSEVEAVVREGGEWLASSLGLHVVDLPRPVPHDGRTWGMGGLPMLLLAFRDHWPDCVDQLTPELAMGAGFVEHYRAEHAAQVEEYRVGMVEAMAEVFDAVDLVICATNPYEAFAATGPPPYEIEGEHVDPFDTGALTMPGNVAGHPAVSIPIGTSASGLPIGLQVYADRFREDLLLDVALHVERERPWPLVAPGAPV
ncbi:MAG TPA: amidase [Actinomycetota bacterium]|nr:amidase [Actinomycetota bacterium]